MTPSSLSICRTGGLTTRHKSAEVRSWPSQEALHPVVADFSVHESGQPGCRRLSEGAHQIVALQVKQFVVFHTPSLLKIA